MDKTLFMLVNGTFYIAERAKYSAFPISTIFSIPEILNKTAKGARFEPSWLNIKQRFNIFSYTLRPSKRLNYEYLMRKNVRVTFSTRMKKISDNYARMRFQRGAIRFPEST